METLKKFRESLNLTQKEFAENIEVSTSFYTKIELRSKKTK